MDLVVLWGKREGLGFSSHNLASMELRSLGWHG